MNTTRLEAFSDCVMSIIITIMILGFKIPHGNDFFVLKPLIPAFLSYILSFVYLGIYWNNHHHLLHGTDKVNGNILWANLHLLFWLSIVPFATAWMGENHFSKVPLALYGVVLLMSAIAYWLLQFAIIKYNGRNSIISKALGKDLKGKLSPIIYLVAIGMAFVSEWISGLLYVVVAGMWLIPDKRIEDKLEKKNP